MTEKTQPEQTKNQPEKPKKQLTFDDFDKLDLESFAEDLFQVIDQGLKSPIGEMGEKKGWTISLNAPFGNGKTTFLKMFENYVKSKNSKGNDVKPEKSKSNDKQKDYEVLFINAWESDFSKKPVIAILAEFVKHLKKEDQKSIIKKIDLTKIQEIAGNLANQFIQSKIGLNLKEAMSDKELGKNLLDNFNQKKSAIKKVKKILSKYHKETGKKLLIIVDELDRTRPDYAVHFLEDMKHFFDIENVAFLVAVNQKQMKATVKCLFGLDEDFEGYYRKFFKQEMDLPDPYIKAQNFIDNLISEITLKNKIKFHNRDNRIKSIYLSCKMFQLTLREIEIFIRIFEMILGNQNSNMPFEYMDAYSFFICLFLKRKKDFKSISKGDFNVDKFISFIEKNSSLKIFIEDPKNEKFDDERFLLRVITHSFLKREPKSDFEKDKQTLEKTFSWKIETSMFSDHGSVAIQICKKIERCKINL